MTSTNNIPQQNQLNNKERDYEGALLGLIMLEPDPRIYDVQAILPDARVFADPIHRSTYEILQELAHADALPSSPALAAEALYTNSQQSGVKSKFATREEALAYVNSLINNREFTSSAYMDYASMVRWAADRRSLRELATDILANVDKTPFNERENYTSNLETKLGAISMSIHAKRGLHHVSQSTSEVETLLTKLHNGETITAVTKTGVHGLDRVLGGFNPGEMIVLAGRPGAGKSALAFQIALNVAQGHTEAAEPVAPKTVFLFNLEMMEGQVIDRFVSNLSRVSIDKFKKESERLISGTYTGVLKEVTQKILENQYERTMIALDYINKLPIELTAQAGLNPNTIKSMINQKKRALGDNAPELGLVIIDYLQLMTPATRQHSRETEVADISKRIKQIAKECNVPILLLSQLNRDAEIDERPDLKNLRESGSIEQDADKVIFVWNKNSKKKKEDYRAETKDEDIQQKLFEKDRMIETITIAKNRQGSTGDVDVVFDWSMQVFASQTSIYVNHKEEFIQFFEKYYRKTRTGEDLFWPLTPAKIVPGMEKYQHAGLVEDFYLSNDKQSVVSTVSVYKKQNQMRVVSRSGFSNSGGGNDALFSEISDDDSCIIDRDIQDDIANTDVVADSSDDEWMEWDGNSVGKDMDIPTDNVMPELNNNTAVQPARGNTDVSDANQVDLGMTDDDSNEHGRDDDIDDLARLIAELTGASDV